MTKETKTISNLTQKISTHQEVTIVSCHDKSKHWTEVIPFISPLGLTMTPALSADQWSPNLANPQAKSTKTGHTIITMSTVSQQTHGNKKYRYQILNSQT